MMNPQVIDIPQAVRDLAPAPEEFWEWGTRAGHGWSAWKKFDQDEFVGIVHRHCELHEDKNIPQFIKEIDVWDEDTMLSGFVGDNLESNSSLGWHVDTYQVYAFNIEGETVWEYFSLRSGKIETIELGEMDKMIFMPCGVTHQVKVLSEYRTSLSLVQRGELSGMKLPFKRHEWIE